MSNNEPISFESLARLSQRLRTGELTSTALVEHFLSRIERLDGKLHAFVSVDAAGALREAGLSDRRHAEGKRLGPLDGLPVAVKDMFDIEGQVTACGSAHWHDRLRAGSSTVVQRLRAAGMCVIGKTQMVEFAFGAWGTNPHLGTPWNPWDLATHRIPGGSSSGSAVAVAAGMVPVAIGSDTGGSVRTPAALNGITGLKTSSGRISLHGALALSESLDTAGPLCRTAEDAALMLAALADVDPDDPRTTQAPPFDLRQALESSTDLSDVRIVAMKESDFLVPVDPQIAESYRDAKATLASLGASLTERPFPFDMNEIIRECGVMMAAEGWQAHQGYIEDAALPFGPWVRERIMAGKSLAGEDFERASRLHRKLSARWKDWMADADAFISPALPIPACPVAEVDERATTLAAFARAGNFLGTCGLTLPVGATETGLPLALQVLGKPFDEALLVRIGRAFQSRTTWHLRAPDLASLDAHKLEE
jgi:aspartyl-tRNA(Asn)/glutamyl-tRNA(Gln) amidotransferase subunit A